VTSDTPTPEDTVPDFTRALASALSDASDDFGMRPAPPAEDRLLGEELGDVTILRIIADGGMGRVYEGLQHKPRRTVAVKVIRNVKKYRDAAVIEIVVLDAIKAGDKDNSR
jgi:dual-specificity kinase